MLFKKDLHLFPADLVQEIGGPKGLSLASLGKQALLRGYEGVECLPFLLRQHPTLWEQESSFDREASCKIAELFPPFPDKSPLPLQEASLGLWADASTFFSLSGYGSPLGGCSFEGIEIPAFGPHFAPLTHTHLFGIRGKNQAMSLDAAGISGWTCAYGCSDFWLYPTCSKTLLGFTLSLRWIGSVQKRAFFAFYVKGESVTVENKVIEAGSLQRYLTKTSSLSFNRGVWSLDCSDALSIEIIPLAGEDFFFGANFLIACELFSPTNTQETLDKAPLDRNQGFLTFEALRG